MKHLDISVRGRVQGVFFRASTRDKARVLGLCGTVRNLPDGSVFVEAEGTEAALASLVDWLHEGPPAARVEEVLVRDGPMRHYAGFEVV